MEQVVDTQEPTPEEALAGSEGVSPAGVGAQEEEQQIPLAIALLAQTRRVREQVLPAYYGALYKPAGNALKVDPTLAIILMNGALTTAEQALINQDGTQMMFAMHQLAAFDV